MIDKFGRKTALICNILPSFIGWSLLYWNYNETVLILGQTINGLTIGSLLYTIHVYASECILAKDVRLRNMFMVWLGVFGSLGTTTIIGLSIFLNYSQICAVVLTLVATLLAIFCLVIPESPSWLHLQGRIGDAEWSEKKLGIARPILQLQAPAATGDHWNSIISLEKLRRPDVYKPLYINCLLTLLLPAAGTVTVTMYMINIIQNNIPGTQVVDDLAAQSIDANQLSLISSAFSIAGALAASFVIPVMGVRRLFIVSNSSVILSLAILTYCSLDGAAHVLLLRVVAIALLTFTSGAGLGPWMTAMGDMFPADCKGLASIPTTIGCLSLATANKVFPYLYQAFGGFTYCFYGFNGILGIIFLYALYPEVVGKTLDEINEEFQGKRVIKIVEINE